jgi:hypothetical protein
LFDSLINDEFFIDLTNSLEKVITLFGEFVDSVGGLPGILSIVASLMTRIFSKQLATSIDNMVYGFNSLTGVNMANDKQLKDEAFTEATNINTNSLTEVGAAENQGLQSQVEM